MADNESVKQSSEKKKDLRWLFLLLLCLGVLILLFSKSEEPISSKSQFQFQDPAHINRVNQHLKETAINLEAERQQRLLEANRELNRYSNSDRQDAYESSTALSFEGDPNMIALTQELDGSRELRDHELSPEQFMQKQLYEREIREKANEVYREQYAEQFVENARKGGWDVRLGPNYEVLSVKKLAPRKRQPTQLFDNGATGSR